MNRSWQFSGPLDYEYDDAFKVGCVRCGKRVEPFMAKYHDAPPQTCSYCYEADLLAVARSCRKAATLFLRISVACWIIAALLIVIGALT